MDSKNAVNPPAPGSSFALHEPFLRHAAEGNGPTDSDIGLAAFLTLRLADQFGYTVNDPCREALAYQCSATKKFVTDIRPPSEHTAMLSDLVWVAEVALESDEPRLLFPPLLAFAYCLEKESSLDGALDVLETSLRLSDGRDAEEEVAALLQKARILRVSGRLVEARASYTDAGAMALRIGDKHSHLLSRVGRGIVARQLGNLPESEQLLRSVIADSCEFADTDAEARASHDLAGTLHFAGRATEAASLCFRAYELYDDPKQQAVALSDTGAILKELGQYTAAKDALSVVLEHELAPDTRARTELEYLDLAALIGDRLTFERFRQSLQNKAETLLPETRQDLELKLGVGLSLFEEHEHAAAHLQRAVELAEQFGMAERMFHSEQQLDQARQGQIQPPTVPEPVAADGPRRLRETVDRLEHLAAVTLS